MHSVSNASSACCVKSVFLFLTFQLIMCQLVTGLSKALRYTFVWIVLSMKRFGIASFSRLVWK
jgi:hypothetical protein